MHERPTAQQLIEGNREGNRFLSFNQVRPPREESAEWQKWKEKTGGDQARDFADYYDYLIRNQVGGKKGVREKKHALFGKTAALIFQNPNSGLEMEGSPARRSRYGASCEESIFESPRYNR